MVNIQCVVHALNIRSAPNSSAPIVAGLLEGQQGIADSYAPSAWLHVTSPHEGYLYSMTAQGKATVVPYIPLPTTPPDLPDDTAKWQVNTDVLNVRSGPGTTYPILAQLKRGAIIACYAHSLITANGYKWVRIASSTPQWVASDLMLRVDSAPPIPVPPPTTPGTFALPFDPTRYGGHANPGGYVPDAAECAVFSRNHIDYALIVAYQAGRIGSIAALQNAGVRQFLVRPAVNGGANSDDFIRITLPIVQEFAQVLGGNLLIQLGNEPNFVDEGWTRFWNNGGNFSAWWLYVANAYRRALPGIRLGFAPMSPGGAIPGQRMAETDFIAGCTSAIQSADFAVVHNYWSKSDASDLEVPIAQWRRQLIGKALVIGESGPGGTTPVTAEAVHHAHLMYATASIPACFYIIDGSGAFDNADWKRNNITV